MALVLRHDPSVIGITLDKNGWAEVTDLVSGVNNKGVELDLVLLEALVAEDSKKRFTFNEDRTKIRANQGHSVKVDVELKLEVPLAKLYHGTVERFVVSIMEHGLQKMSRQHVDLSHELDTALSVGSRRGEPILLEVDAGEMHQDGIKFYVSANGVWLVDFVHPRYIKRV